VQMNAVKIACASSANASPWSQLDWGNCERQVNRLQACIVKATRAGRWGKVKALQWLLTHSFSGKALAVRRVTGNQGKDTAGVDGAVWRSPHAKYNAIASLASTARLSATTPTPRVHSESQWQVKTAWYSDARKHRPGRTGISA
jgi:RNA-directed DNA polymerase